MKKLSVISISIVIFLLSGCASLLSKSEYDVTIKSNVPNTNVVVRNHENGAVVGGGVVPFVVKLKASNGFFSGATYALDATTVNGQKYTMFAISKIDPIFWGNFFFGGFLGIVVDAASGAMFKFDETFFLNLPAPPAVQPQYPPQNVNAIHSFPNAPIAHP